MSNNTHSDPAQPELEGGTHSPDPSDDVLPAVIRTQNGHERFIAYDSTPKADEIADRWFSVDAESVVSLSLWR